MDVFKEIGNPIHSFVQVDESYKHSSQCKIACILVEFDLWEGLAYEIYLDLKGKIYFQTIDYVGILFYSV
jgi:hypothetical protein